MPSESLESRIERHFAAGPAATQDSDAHAAFAELRAALEAGTIRSAQPDASAPPAADGGTAWRVNAWVKRGILLGFRLGALV